MEDNWIWNSLTISQIISEISLFHYFSTISTTISTDEESYVFGTLKERDSFNALANQELCEYIFYEYIYKSICKNYECLP